MNWNCRFTVVDVSLPVEMEREWRAAVKLLLDALERVETEPGEKQPYQVSTSD